MEDRSIPDSALSASSSYGHQSNPSFWAKDGRLNIISSWAPSSLSVGQYLQVDLGQVKIVTKIATQGRPGDQVKYVTKYKIKWSIDGQTWEDHKENDVVKVFNGNFDQNSVVTNSFQPKIMSRYIRLVVQEWFDYINLRMELYGC
ncbi:lactadherin-like [Actinia tenebrosa]|uniref:Lactadherin-like n=1 Tax=Actinia tenebrosa TaxID=6105 RepID=A0A6P8I477_ACTTE|nr:lactadherin-like [Actinia tenebrosa]